jgi:hypothetical protein
MLTEQQLSDRLRASLHRELAAIEPSNDFVERLQARALDERTERSTRSAQERRAWLPSLGGVVSMVGSLLVVALVAGALLSLGGSRQPAGAGSSSGREQLVRILAVLRRPQTNADLSGLRGADPPPLLGIPDRPLVRRATTTPWGQTVFFVPVKPPRLDLRSHPEGRGTPPSTSTLVLPKTEVLALRVEPIEQKRVDDLRGTLSLSGWQSGPSAAQILSGQGPSLLEAPVPRVGQLPSWSRLAVVVPDGVAKVAFGLPRQPWPNGPSYASGQTVTVAVRDNLAAFDVHRYCCGAETVTGGSTPPMIWYDAEGHVIKRIGNFSLVNRLVEPPSPTPETALSRRAEHDPSTPNPVWIVPHVVGPHASLSLEFQALLSNADYVIRAVGPTGRNCTGANNLSGGSTGTRDNNVRGQLFRTELTPPLPGEVRCPGTYRISVSVGGIGTHQFHQPAAPFGSVTFTVRR